jgi:hypothetical protein
MTFVAAPPWDPFAPLKSNALSIAQKRFCHIFHAFGGPGPRFSLTERENANKAKMVIHPALPRSSFLRPPAVFGSERTSFGSPRKAEMALKSIGSVEAGTRQPPKGHREA